MTEYAVFISYSRRDAEVVVPIVQILRAAGGGVFRDAESIPPGTRWRAVIADAIGGCETLLLFWCAHSAVSTEVRMEWGQALGLRKPVVPVLLDHTPLPADLAEYQGIDMRGYLGDHREDEVEVEKKFCGAMPGGESTRRVRRMVLQRPEPIGLVFGGLDLWERLGGILSGKPSPTSARYNLDDVNRILVGGEAASPSDDT